MRFKFGGFEMRGSYVSLKRRAGFKSSGRCFAAKCLTAALVSKLNSLLNPALLLRVPLYAGENHKIQIKGNL